MKTISISDEVYEMLVRLKKGRSFSDTIRELIQTNVEKRVDFLIQTLKKTGYEEEFEGMTKNIRDAFSIR